MLIRNFMPYTVSLGLVGPELEGTTFTLTTLSFQLHEEFAEA